MFNIAAKPLFKYTLKLDLLVEDKQTTQSMVVTYRPLTDEQFEGYDQTTAEGTKARIRAFVQTIDDLVDDKGMPVTFTPAVLDQLLEVPWMRAALVAGYFQAVVLARSGN